VRSLKPVAFVVVVFLVELGVASAALSHLPQGSLSVSTLGPSLPTNEATTLTPVPPDQSEPAPTPDLSPPTQIQIPSIGVKAGITKVGKVKDEFGRDRIGAPTNGTDTAWFDGSARPGDSGNAVLDGHVNWYGLIPGTTADAVFTRLYQLKQGDQILILTQGGKQLTFLVDNVNPFNEDFHAPTGLLSRDGPPRLTLITCWGHYDRTKQTYNQRVYVSAHLLT